LGQAVTGQLEDVQNWWTASTRTTQLTDSTNGGLDDWLCRQYIHFYSQKLQLQKQKLQKNKEKRDTQRVKEHNVSNAYYLCSAEAQDNINIENR